MVNWLSKLFRPTEDKLMYASDEQACRLELEEAKRKLHELQDQVHRQQSGENARIAEALRVKLETLFADAAVPVSQILTQEHLMEAEGKLVQTTDVMLAAKRLIRSLEDAGMKIEGEVGAVTAFNPNLHEPLSSEESISPGQSVVLRFAGVSHQGKIIRKAGVERVKEN